MNNYSNYSTYDNSTDIFCDICGKRIEDTVTFAPDTEYEREVNWCEKCFEHQLGKEPKWEII